ncbi:ABC transporter ATP-binding protein [Mesorhizobium sp. SB112]|uniref:ABC transporter ATP-binding protein n=1 Tax=Mesorhizobium sp. SB112 TaxID=3151853 RepID=UPI00326362D1
MTVVLCTDKLVKRFGGLLATDNVDLTVEEGEIHAVIGPNGAGKSTLINQLCGNLQPNEGRIFMGGSDVTMTAPAERVRRGLGRTFQITSLLGESTVRQNLSIAFQARLGNTMRILDAFSKHREVWQETDTMLAQSPLAHRADIKAENLSHGERKQLELLMALAGKPKVLLLDEPMAGLGHTESRDMVETLKALRGAVSMLLVEHDMDAVAAMADRVSVLVYGRIIMTGTMKEVRESAAVREAYLGEDIE